MAPRKMHHDVDPKKATIEALGDISGVDLFNNQVLVAVYMRPEKSAGGIIYTDRARDEDKWQGKVGLVMKMGPVAFKGDDEWFKGVNVKVGDWVLFRPSDGWQLELNGSPCRVMSDISVKGKIPSPDIVW